MRTEEERMLLELMSSGALDGFVGDDLTTSGGSTVWMQIKNGIPAQYKEGPGGKFLMGRRISDIQANVMFCKNGKLMMLNLFFSRSMDG